MIFKGSWPSVPLRRCLPCRLPGCSYSTPWHLQEFQNKRQVKSAPDCSSTQRRLLWGSSEPPQHFGPKTRIPDLFERKDAIHLKLAAQQLEWCERPPRHHHDMLEAVSRVGRIEERIQYTFRNKMLCVEALKITALNYPLFFKGMVHKVKPNNRLALLGDRVLSMVLCDIWYSTGYSPAHYMKARQATETTSKLHSKAHKFSIDREVLIGEGVSAASVRQSAESLEAILGAVYVDSDRNLETVKQVIKSIELDRHQFLQALPEAHPELQDWKWQHIVYREEEQLFEERIKSLEHKAEELQNHWRDAESFTTGVSGAKPNISPEAQSAIRTEAAKLEIDARQLLKEVEQAPISAVCTQVKEITRKRTKIMIHTALALQSEMDHSDGIIEEQSTEELATGPTTTDDLDPINENPPPDESAPEGAPEKTEEQPDSLTRLFLSKNSRGAMPKLAISASQRSSSIPADSVLPRDRNPVIIALIDEFNEVVKQHHTSRTRNIGIWSNKEFGLKLVAWSNALTKTRTLERRGETVDTLAMYEDMLQKALESSLPAERKALADRKKMALSKKAKPAVSLEVEKPTTSTPAKEETNLTKEQDQGHDHGHDQGQRKEKKRLAPAHNRHQKETKEFLETIKHSEHTAESVEDLERNISEFHTAAWEITNKTAERVPQRLSRRPLHRPQTSIKIGSLTWKTTSPRQGKTTSEAPPRTWSMRKPRKTLIRYQDPLTQYGISTFSSRPRSRDRADP